MRLSAYMRASLPNFHFNVYADVQRVTFVSCYDRMDFVQVYGASVAEHCPTGSFRYGSVLIRDKYVLNSSSPLLFFLRSLSRDGCWRSLHRVFFSYGSYISYITKAVLVLAFIAKKAVSVSSMFHGMNINCKEVV